MPALFVFLLKVNIALLLFCAGYYLVLRHLTFYTLNRIYLVSAILFATAYPLVNLDSFAQRHQKLPRVVVLNLQAESLVKPVAVPAYWHWAEVLLFAGAALLALRLFVQLFSLYKVYRNSNPQQIHGHSVRVINSNDGPFSFWRNIYVNPAAHQPADLQSILMHEQVHTDELHTLDVLLAELSIICYWFNPGVWLMRKAVRENIEFITDRKILQKGIDSKKYQYSLLNVSFAATQPGIANHFNISTLKKRIIMMNAERSARYNLTRYAFLVPAVLICLLTFSFSKAELIKKSKNTYKSITTSVGKITGKTELVAAPVGILFQHPYASKLTKKNKKDTIKIIRSATKDTIKVINKGGFGSYTISGDHKDFGYTTQPANVVYNDGASTLKGTGGYFYLKTDTNQKGRSTFSLANQTDSIIIFVDGKKVPNMSSVDPNNIQTVEVSKPNNIGMVNITTKGANGPLITELPNKVFPNKQQSKVILTDVPLYRTSSNTVLIKTDSASKKKITGVKLMSTNTSSNIEHIPNHLIFIDGKEASSDDLKKIPASDIESINVKKGEEMFKQYGDKAKNGVVFITSKKAK